MQNNKTAHFDSFQLSCTTFIYRWFRWGAAIFRLQYKLRICVSGVYFEFFSNLKIYTDIHNGNAHQCWYAGPMWTERFGYVYVCVCARKFHPFVFWLCEENVTGLNKFLNIPHREIILLLFLTTASPSSRYLCTPIMPKLPFVIPDRIDTVFFLYSDDSYFMEQKKNPHFWQDICNAYKRIYATTTTNHTQNHSQLNLIFNHIYYKLPSFVDFSRTFLLHEFLWNSIRIYSNIIVLFFFHKV